MSTNIEKNTQHKLNQLKLDIDKKEWMEKCVAVMLVGQIVSDLSGGECFYEYYNDNQAICYLNWDSVRF